MLKKYVIAGAVAAFCAGSAANAQQTPQQQTPAQPTTAQTAAATTVEGCVYREQDIAGRTPNVAERAGVLEDYILVASSKSASGAVGTSGSATTGTAATGAAATGTMTPKMFKLEHAEDNKLSAMVGKRVQVTGRVDAEMGDRTAATSSTPQADRSAGPDKIELPEFEVTSITEMTSGEPCPAKPAVDRK